MKAVESFLKPENCAIELERKTITNIKFYVAMIVSIKLVGDKQDIDNKLALLPNIDISETVLRESLELVLNEFNELGATDQVAKGSVLVGNLLR
jgi:hypothetical protein